MSQAQAIKPATQARATSRKGKGKQESQAPAQETTPVESQAPAQETTPVETAMPESTVGPVKFMRNPMNGYLSGAKLFAHTVAFIKATTGGIPGVEMPQFRTVIGASAYAYHKGKGNLTTGATGAPCLTEQGSEFFATRKHEQALLATFEHMFATGETPAGMDRHPPVRIAK